MNESFLRKKTNKERVRYVKFHKDWTRGLIQSNFYICIQIVIRVEERGKIVNVSNHL